MDYTPPVPASPKPQAPSYELKKDITGKPPEKRGVQMLKDKNGTEVKLPYPPKEKCKKCYGRGYIGTDARTGRFVICVKCYPMLARR